MGKARRLLGELAEAEGLVAPVRMRDAHRYATRVRGVPVEALVADVEPLAPAVEQLPQTRRREVALRVRVARIIRELHRWAASLEQSSLDRSLTPE
jgi:hypothetical protein